MTPIRIFAVDDQEISHAMLSSLIDGDSMFSICNCREPLQALSLIQQDKPTIILLDLIMPDIDGLLLLRYIKECAPIKDIPVVVLSVKEDEHTKAQAFHLGAVDYMVKFPGALEFKSRIQLHAEQYIQQQKQKKLLANTEKTRARLGEEAKEAIEYLRSLLPQPITTGNILCDWRYLPSATIGGDLFHYSFTEPGQFSFYIFDVSGHGIKTALHANSIYFAIQALQKDPDMRRHPDKILKQLNDDFQMEKFDNTFFSMWYGVFDIEKKTLTYASGGHPPAIAFTPHIAGEKEELLYTHGMALGIDVHSQYESFSIEMPQSSRLYLCSDGVYELTDTAEKLMTFDAFVTIVKQPSFPGVTDLDRILHNTEVFRADKPFDDDVLLVQIDYI